MPSFLRTLPSRFDVDREKAQRNLYEFIKQAWHVVEPATQFVDGWHIGAISEFLMAMRRLEFLNGYINIPPRHAKSLLTGVFLPSWVWATTPADRWLTSSYADGLATRDAVKHRRLIESPWYRERWGDVFSLAPDQNQKTRFENDKTGYRIAHGVGSGATGEGGDWIVTDDPMKALDAESDAELDRVQEWWSGTMATRGNDPKTARRLVIMQRLSMRDLTGYVQTRMERGGARYEGLILPAEYELNRMTVMPDCKWRDPRTEPNEPLWPERYGPKELQALKDELGSESAVAGQLQQRPVPKGGAIYKEAWWEGGRNRYTFEVAKVLNEAIATYLSVDTALKDKDDSDYTAISVFALMPDYRVRLIEVWRDHKSFTDLVEKIVEVAAWANNRDRHGKGILRGVIIEDKGSGTSAIQTLKKTAPPWLRDLLVAFLPVGDKPYRARQAAVWCGRDCILLPLPSETVLWLFEFERELFQFPRSEHDDMADTFSQFIIYLEHYIAAGWRARVYPDDPYGGDDELDDRDEM